MIEKYSVAQVDATAAMLADAFAGSPLHNAAFGARCVEDSRRFFRIGLRHMFFGRAYVALIEGRVCGYVHFNAYPNCLPAPEQIPLVAATTLKPLGLAIPQIIRWYSRWCRLDPDEAHLHLGPIGVSPEVQGNGIGSALMRHYIDCLGRENVGGYLETDRLENVDFYRKFGFLLRHEERVIDTPTWFMWRPLARD